MMTMMVMMMTGTWTYRLRAHDLGVGVQSLHRAHGDGFRFVVPSLADIFGRSIPIDMNREEIWTQYERNEYIV
jgi:hypothetical protein